MKKPMKFFLMVTLLVIGVLSSTMSSVAENATAAAPESAQQVAVAQTSADAVSTRVASYLPRACQISGATMLCASKAKKRVYLIRRGSVIASAEARFGGRASDGSGPWFTREGTFRIGYKDSYAFSTLYHVYMPYFQQFSGGQGIHYSSEFAGGYRYSHGCIGVRSMSFARLAFKTTRVGNYFVVTRY